MTDPARRPLPLPGGGFGMRAIASRPCLAWLGLAGPCAALALPALLGPAALCGPVRASAGLAALALGVT